MGNPLVADAEAPTGQAGTGLIGDIVNLTQDHDPWDYTIDGISAGLDAIGMAFDPFGALAGAGVGWLLQHIDFLREGIDRLTGDTAAIEALSQTWTNIADRLQESARDYATALHATDQWSGDAARDYRNAALEYIAALDAIATHCQHASEGVTAAGIVVGTERAIVYDTISTFVGRLVVEALVALASSWFTFGASIGAFVAAVDIEAATQAEEVGLRFGALTKKLADFARRFSSMSSRAQTLARDLDRAGGKMRQVAGRNKGLKSIRRNRFLARPHNPAVSSLINASRHLEHSPLNTVHDVVENKAVRQGTEGAKTVDEHHKSTEGDGG